MLNKLLLAAVVVLAGVVVWQASDDDAAPAPAADAEAVRERLADFGDIQEVTHVPEAGLYRVRIGGESLYVTEDARYLLAGDLYDLETRENLTRRAQSDTRRERLAEVEASDAVVYEPAADVARIGTVWVFTDVDCPYCRKFHEQIGDYTARGIEVRYLAYPRQGPGSESWRRTEAVWCAEDRKRALTRAKSGAAVDGGDCSTDLVAEHYALGQAVGLRGTPMIVGVDGRVYGGYVSPADLAKRLDGQG
ncbi:disulfide bond isomerase DsbC/G [Salinisphaera sp. PC39]|uniref:DsbC family protein n=1 Tax=Salinisphaera sp. PC39 TaxID=1304156 RepID=UPI0033422241